MNSTKKKKNTLQELTSTLSEQIVPFSDHLSKVINIRETLWAATIEKLYKDLDALQPLFQPLGDIAHQYFEYVAMSTAFHIAELLAKLELELVLLEEEVGGSQKKTRKLLEQQRTVKELGEDVLTNIAELQEQIHKLQQKQAQDTHAPLSLVKSDDTVN